MLVPIWWWPAILLMPRFFRLFPYERQNIESDWKCDVMTIHYWGRVDIVDTFQYKGKLKNAYVKVRIRALKLSFRYNARVYGIEYGIKGANDDA